jgi:hypothetical protein
MTLGSGNMSIAVELPSGEVIQFYIIHMNFYNLWNKDKYYKTTYDFLYKISFNDKLFKK